MNSCLVLSLLVLVLAVAAEARHLDKRAVHRIVIKGRRARSHPRPHKHKAHRYHHHNDASDESGSYEPRYRDDSREASYEEPPRRYKPHRKAPRQHHEREKPEKDAFFARDKPHSEWSLDGSPESFSPPAFDTKRNVPKKNTYKHLNIELTTSFPQKNGFYPLYDSNDFPVYSPGVFHQNNSYEVHENHKDDGFLHGVNKADPFKALLPVYSNSYNAGLVADASKVKEVVVAKNATVGLTGTKVAQPQRGRGRVQRIKLAKKATARS